MNWGESCQQSEVAELPCVRIAHVTSELLDESGHGGGSLRRVTAADVARESGVSRTTVSYVLNDTPGVSISPETRAHVLGTAARLNYTPSAAAKILRSGKSDLVLVLLPHWVTSKVTEAFLDELDGLLTAAGLTMLVHHGDSPERLSRSWRTVNPRAVISSTPFTSAELRELSQAGVQALTTLEASDKVPGQLPSLQERIGRLQVDYLVAAGHQIIGCATSSNAALQRYAVPRMTGVRLACEERDLPTPAVAAVELDLEPARSVIASWRQQKPHVTAVAAYNDEVALAILGAARLESIRVPEDLAIIGVDDIPAARLVVPPLTTVVLAAEAEARYLAAAILGTEASPAPPERPEQFLTVVARGTA